MEQGLADRRQPIGWRNHEQSTTTKKYSPKYNPVKNTSVEIDEFHPMDWGVTLSFENPLER